MLKFLCLIVFVASTLAAPSNQYFRLNTISTSSERILGGKDAPVGEFPYQASLRQQNGRHFCGGTIIAKRFILTATQCTRNVMNPDQIFIVVGARLLSSGGTFYAVDQIFNHPRFELETLKNDVAVIRTVKRITWTTHIQRIALPTSGGLPLHGDLLTIVTGWGKIKAGSDHDHANHPDILQYKNTTTMNKYLCTRALGANSKYIHKNTICTSNELPKTGNCMGDLGGPLAHRDAPRALVGIISSTNCGNGLPDVYANVFEHMAFIRRAMDK